MPDPPIIVGGGGRDVIMEGRVTRTYFAFVAIPIGTQKSNTCPSELNVARPQDYDCYEVPLISINHIWVDCHKGGKPRKVEDTVPDKHQTEFWNGDKPAILSRSEEQEKDDE